MFFIAQEQREARKDAAMAKERNQLYQAFGMAFMFIISVMVYSFWLGMWFFGRRGKHGNIEV